MSPASGSGFTRLLAGGNSSICCRSITPTRDLEEIMRSSGLMDDVVRELQSKQRNIDRADRSSVALCSEDEDDVFMEA
ncbi:hypothetical protein EYF80_040181 [Liparis tanakae]|uniref:Uncharacterized protein n=1 Tax=Liparis tanakae TaxID=230148 RepID=A0A4Z2G9I9_9TELE|nr:hypothetical protein EYF80_040181 [Liparis tanakae]